jgi:hypothetical protein
MSGEKDNAIENPFLIAENTSIFLKLIPMEIFRNSTLTAIGKRWNVGFHSNL